MKLMPMNAEFKRLMAAWVGVDQRVAVAGRR